MKAQNRLTVLVTISFLISISAQALESTGPKNSQLSPIETLVPETQKPEVQDQLSAPKKEETNKKEEKADKNPDPVNGGPKGGLTSGDKDKPDLQKVPGIEVKDPNKKVPYSEAMAKILTEKKVDATLCEKIYQVNKADFKVVSAEELLVFFNIISTCAADGLVDTKQIRFKSVVDLMRLEIENRFKSPDLYDGENSPACRGIDKTVVDQVLEFMRKFLPINLPH